MTAGTQPSTYHLSTIHTRSVTFLSELPIICQARVVRHALSGVLDVHSQDLGFNVAICQLIRLRLPVGEFIDTLCVTDYPSNVLCPHALVVSSLVQPNYVELKRRTIELVAPHVHRIRVELQDEGGIESLIRLVNLVTKNCMNVRALAVIWLRSGSYGVRALEALIRRVGSGLDSLELRFDVPPAYPNASEKLVKRLVSCAAEFCSSVKYFKYHGSNFRLLRPLWKLAGRNLEALYLTGSGTLSDTALMFQAGNKVIQAGSKAYNAAEDERQRQWSSVVRDVGSRCRALTVVCLDRAPEDGLKKLLCSYGSQLRYAEVGDVSKATCETLRRECPNAELGVTLGTRMGFRALPVLNNAVVRLSAAVTVRDADVLSSGLEHCSSMEQLDVVDVGSGSSGSALSAERLFSHPLPRLSTLALRLRVALTDRGARALAGATGSLRSIHLCLNRIATPESLHIVVDANAELEALAVIAGTLAPGHQRTLALCVLRSAWRGRRIKHVMVACSNESDMLQSPRRESLTGEIENEASKFRSRCATLSIYGHITV